MKQISLLTVSLLLSIAVVQAQDVIAPPPPVSTAPAALQDIQGAPIGVPKLSLPSTGQSPFEWGPIIARPHFLYRFVYGTGIHPQPTNTTATALHEISPGVLFELGTHWTADFTPTWSYYSDKQLKDTFGYNASLNGATAYNDWIFTLSQTAAKSTSPQIETASQVELETYGTAFGASRQLNQKLSLDLSVDQDIQDSDQFNSSAQWTAMGFLNYHFAPRLSAGIGAGGGYAAVETSPDMAFEQVQAQLRWKVATKLNLSIRAGAEERQILISGAGSLFNPTYGATLGYQPFEFTTFNLTAQRSVSPSLFQAQVLENTSVNASFSQRLLGHLYLTLAGGYGAQGYVATAPSASVKKGPVFSPPGRNDENYNFSARLTLAFLKRASASVFYQYSDNISDTPGFGYTSNQGGVELGYRF